MLICRGAVQLPPYDTTAPLHRQQEPPRTATHSKTQKARYAKTKKETTPAAAPFFIFITRGEHLPRGGATRKPSLIYYIKPCRFTPCGVLFFACRQTRPGFSHTSDAARKGDTKASQKRRQKNFYFFNYSAY